MSDEQSTLTTINAAPFHDDLESLSKIGATEEGGVNRPAFREDHQAARKWFVGRVEEAGLSVKIDAASNHSAFLEFPRAEKTLLIGSHLGTYAIVTVGVIRNADALARRLCKDRRAHLAAQIISLSSKPRNPDEVFGRDTPSSHG